MGLPGGLVGAVPYCAMHTRPSFREKFSYKLDNLMSLNPAFKLFGLFGLTAVLVFIGGSIYWLITLGNEELASDPIHGLWAAWTFIADAGTQGGETTTATRAVAMFITIGGMMIFALLLGLVSETLGEKVDDLKKGRSRVIEEDHSLILGWNEKIFILVQQLIEANESLRRGAIVILSEKDKEEMEEEIRDAIDDFKTSVVVCRSGSTTMPSDLLKVNAAAARSIIVLGDDKDPQESDIRATKTTLALLRAVGNLRGHLVVELMDTSNRHMVEMVGGGMVEVIAARDVIGRLMVQTSRQNGLAHTYAALLAFEGSEFYLKEFPQLNGMKFAQAWKHFPDAVLCGVKPNPKGPNRTKPGEPPVIINPPDDYTFGDGDEGLWLAEDDDAYDFSKNACQVGAAKLPNFQSPPRKVEALLFLGWRSELGLMIRELDNYVAPESTLTLVSTLSREEANERLKQEGVGELKNLKLSYKRGDLASRKDLEALHVEGFNSILVLADEVDSAATPDEVDAHTLMSLLLIRDIQKKNNVKGVPVLSEIRDPRTKDLAAIAEASDYVVSNELTSMLMAQVSEKREMNSVWADLFDADGNEIYLKHSGKYVNPGEKITFNELYSRGRQRGEIVIGYRGAVDDEDTNDDGVIINPADKNVPISLGPRDRVIVLAQDES